MNKEKKRLWSEINRNAFALLENLDRCKGCPFANYDYNANHIKVIDICTHLYYPKNFNLINHEDRPTNCPIKWRYK